MIICGIKITHDGGIALIDNGELKFSIEMEKIDNNARYSCLDDLHSIPAILAEYGYSLDDVDHFAIDGWHGAGAHWRGDPVLSIKNGREPIALTVAAYNELTLKENLLQPEVFESKLPMQGKDYDYRSYKHVTGHICAAYASSPFAVKNEGSFVLIWDGGQYPRLYYVDPLEKTIKNLGYLFVFLGTIYSIMGHYYGPYKKTVAEMKEDREKMTIEGYFGGYSIAGKVMSYFALGKADDRLVQEMKVIYKRELEISNLFEHKFMMAVADYVEGKPYSDADVLASMHVFLEGLLLEGLAKKVNKFPAHQRNICFAGGSALNIKWNSKIRGMKLFNDVWVPPFPNDAGSALGVACAAMADLNGQFKIDWNVYAGPALRNRKPKSGWKASDCTVKELAEFLAKNEELVVFLNGNAELGPRALGNRSILAPATSLNVKNKLNIAKMRESFRPVAPICLEAYASEVFDPGDSDPYMLFDHQVRTAWKDKVPAIVHLDGSARLQSVGKTQNPIVWELLTAYHELTGIPLLCNTSANLRGSGFFPDVESATRWGRANFVWCNGKMYEQIEKFSFEDQSAFEVFASSKSI